MAKNSRYFLTTAISGGEETNNFVAAEGHFGKKSPALVRHYAEDLGFEYLSAASKEEFEKKYKRFVEPVLTDRPIFFELFTTDENENEALKKIMNMHEDSIGAAKSVAKKVLGDKGTKFVKGILGK